MRSRRGDGQHRARRSVVVATLLAWMFVVDGSAGQAAAPSPAQRITPVDHDTIVLRLPESMRTPARPLTLVQRADRLQYLHRYAEAAALLEQWLAQHPDDAGARLRLAQVRLALAQPRAALAECLRAAPGLDALSATGCQAQSMAALGAVARARADVETALARATSSRDVTSWAQGIAAELALRDGDVRGAERWHRAAVANAGSAHFPRIAYSEFLLQQGRSAEVLTLLADVPDDASVMHLRRRALEHSL